MVETKSRRDVCTKSKMAYIGDDTGLIKKVKIVAKKIEDVHEVRYDVENPNRKRQNKDKPAVIYKRKNTLGASDNQLTKKLETEITFKLLNKYGEQKRDEGIRCLHWQNDSQICYLRGKENIVQTFDTDAEIVLQQRQFSELDEVVGVNSVLANSSNSAREKPLIITSKSGQLLHLDSLKTKSDVKHKVKGSHVHKTYINDNLLSVLSKGTTMQIWDVNAQKESWQARNVANDELDLQVPIFDTGMAQTGPHEYAVCTGYGCIRTYDTRLARRARSSNQILENEMMLTHICQSKVNSHLLYVMSQEGVPIVVDSRYNMRQIRRMPNAKGTVRDCTVFLDGYGSEFLATVGCDRCVRVFDHTKEQQKDTMSGSAYLKQKLNCILLDKDDQ